MFKDMDPVLMNNYGNSACNHFQGPDQSGILY